MTVLEKIISGGQTGADQGGLAAAHYLHIPTGGYAPPNYITENGPNPHLRSLYNLVSVELDPKIYPKRTLLNVQHSDGTLWMGNINSPGGNLTLKYCTLGGKPLSNNPTKQQLLSFLFTHSIKVLNVAGNRESRNPGIKLKTYSLLVDTLSGWGGDVFSG